MLYVYQIVNESQNLWCDVVLFRFGITARNPHFSLVMQWSEFPHTHTKKKTISKYFFQHLANEKRTPQDLGKI